jgi:hypothetical protein
MTKGPEYREPISSWSISSVERDVPVLVIEERNLGGEIPGWCRMRHEQRTDARLCHATGGELEQIQFLLGHVPVQTTERTLAASSDSISCQ